MISCCVKLESKQSPLKIELENLKSSLRKARKKHKRLMNLGQSTRKRVDNQVSGFGLENASGKLEPLKTLKRIQKRIFVHAEFDYMVSSKLIFSSNTFLHTWLAIKYGGHNKNEEDEGFTH